jgi:hypothetical protein
MLSILPDPGYRVTVEQIKGVEGTAARLVWKSLGAQPSVRLLSAKSYPGEPDSAAKSRLLDRILYTLLYHMFYDPDGPKLWRDQIKAKSALDLKFPNARAVEAYYAGLQYLGDYLASSAPDAATLAGAEREFQRLQQEMPYFIEGLVLLGITLSEQRNELGAISLYDRAEELLRARMHSEPALRKTWIQARLFKANSYRKLYRWDAVHHAIRDLDAIHADLQTAIHDPNTDPDMKYDFEKIRIAVLAETANTIGYHLVLLFRQNFIEALIGPLVPDSIKPTARMKKLEALADDLKKRPTDRVVIARRDRAFKDEMQALYKVHEKVVANARAGMATIKPPMPAVKKTSAPTEAEKEAMKRAQDAWDHERQRIESLLLSAEGYARFRRAQALEDKPNDFMTECEEALKKLRDANGRQPNNYLVLQDLGLILGDPRYDPTGSQIEVARQLFTRSIELKGDDYYGHQQLALLAVRQINAARAEVADLTLVNAAVASAETSLKKRPGNWVVYLALASLNTAAWAKETDEAKRRVTAERIAAWISDSRKLGGNETRIRAVDLQWQIVRLRGETDEKKFSARQKVLTEALNAVPAGGYPKWEADRLSDAVTKLKKSVAGLKYETRAELVWPN